MKKTLSILITRPRAQAEELETLLIQKFGRETEILFQPTISITHPSDAYAALDAAISELARFRWVVFSSVNGVEAFVKRLSFREIHHSEGETHASFPSVLKFAAIGPGTAAALRESGFPVDFIPEVFRAEDLAEGLRSEAQDGQEFLLIRASRGREVLAETLRSAGGIVTQAVGYSSTDVTRTSPEWKPEILERMEAGTLDWMTVTSSAIAQSSVNLFGDALHRTRLASISPITTSALKKAGFTPSAEAREATMPALVESLF